MKRKKRKKKTVPGLDVCSPVDMLPVTPSILQREVTQCYLCTTESKHTCPAASPKAHNKAGKDQTGNHCIQFPSITHQPGVYSFSSLLFPLKPVGNSVCNFYFSHLLIIFESYIMKIEVNCEHFTITEPHGFQ